jgi:biotin carboxylase
VLLVDAGFSSIPILNALKQKGYFVGVCGAKRDDPCHQLADESFCIDYSNLAALEDIFRKHAYNFLVPGCTDVSYIASATVADKLNVPGFDSVEITKNIFNKDCFREMCASLNISSPKFVTTQKLVSSLQFPILVKPTDSYSGNGIVRFDSYKDFLRRPVDVRREQKKPNLVYEEYVSGELYSHSAFIKNGKIISDFFVLEYSTIHPYQVNSSHLDSVLKEEIKCDVRKSIVKIAKCHNLVDGLIHTQFISDNSRFWLIEMTRRCPGDLYSYLIEFSTEINYSDLYVNSYLGRKGPIRKKIPNIKFYARHTLSSTTETIFSGVEVDVKCQKTIIFNIKKLGDKLKAAPLDRAAVIFLKYKTSKEMQSQAPNLYKKILLKK